LFVFNLARSSKASFMTLDSSRKLPSAPPPTPWLRIVAVAIIGLVAGVLVQEWRIRSYPAPASGGNLQLAEQAFRQGDEKAALTLFSKLADRDNPTAQYWLAHMTELGLGVPRDPAQAVALYQKAATKDVVAAQLRLGEIYLHGDLVPPDFSKAKSYLGKAAYHGSARAAMLLGQLYRVGLGVSPDLKEAYSWSEVARLEGSAFAERERDVSLKGLSPADQQASVARAQVILSEIKKDTIKPEPPRSK
jgi:TPR repeat protein